MGLLLGGSKLIGGANDPPLVSASCLSDSNSRGIGGICWVGVRFNSAGTEHQRNASGTWAGSVGNWLDQGVPGDVWVEFIRTAGETKWDNRSSSTRYNLAATLDFSSSDSDIGSPLFTITGYFRFWDAASGGSLLDQTTTGQVFAADYFNACPMCCFTPQTLITMADGSQKPIVDVGEGELIRVLDGQEPVSGIIVREMRAMFLLTFADERIIEASDDHPFYVEGKGYASIAPDPRIDYKDLGVPQQLAIGDKVVDVEGRSNQIMSIARIDYPDKVYTFENSGFFANGMLVY